ncbi:MAG TPA: class I SAM-dependent methyltransferase [Chitinophagaceae bacterium]|nr:class I SAM-dependent methyltransferase [Chitinophagaceae bacterium]
MKYTHLDVTHNTKAASVIVPFIMNIVKPQSVIDVGCGTGTFLSVFNEHGVKKLMGLEGEWLDKKKLYIPVEFVQIVDIEKPFFFNQKFDLALSLEVAEHLDPNSAPIFVDTLTRLSDVILFSAAIPGQGGQNHVNEQWIEFWQDLFTKKEYSFYDVLRLKFWNDQDVDYWYKQNIFLIIKNGANNFGLSKTDFPINLVHPELFEIVTKRNNTLYEKYTKIAWGYQSPAYYFKLFVKSICHSLGIIK